MANYHEQAPASLQQLSGLFMAGVGLALQYGEASESMPIFSARHRDYPDVTFDTSGIHRWHLQAGRPEVASAAAALEMGGDNTFRISTRGSLVQQGRTRTFMPDYCTLMVDADELPKTRSFFYTLYQLDWAASPQLFGHSELVVDYVSPHETPERFERTKDLARLAGTILAGEAGALRVMLGAARQHYRKKWPGRRPAIDVFWPLGPMEKVRKVYLF